MLALLAHPAKPPAWADASDLMIVNVQAPASLVPTAKTAVIYFAIVNHGPESDRLIAVSTPAAKSASLHESVADGDVMMMRELQAIDVPSGGFVELKQGAIHVMLTGLVAPLIKDEMIELSLTFEKSGVIPVKVKIGDKVSGHLHPTP